MNFVLPLPQVCVAVLIGVVLLDLKFDLHPNKTYTLHYYAGHSSFFFPFLEVVIVAMFSSTIYNLVEHQNIWNIVALVSLVVCLFFFAVFLNPLNESVTVEKSAAEQAETLRKIKFWHFVILFILLQTMVFLFLGGRVNDSALAKQKVA